MEKNLDKESPTFNREQFSKFLTSWELVFFLLQLPQLWQESRELALNSAPGTICKRVPSEILSPSIRPFPFGAISCFSRSSRGLLCWHVLRSSCYMLHATSAVESSCLLGMNCLTGHNTLQLYTFKHVCVSSATHNCLDEHSGTLYLAPTRDSCHPTAWLDNSIPYNIPIREWQPRANVFIANHRVVSLKVIAVWLSNVTGAQTGGAARIPS